MGPGIVNFTNPFGSLYGTFLHSVKKSTYITSEIGISSFSQFHKDVIILIFALTTVFIIVLNRITKKNSLESLWSLVKEAIGKLSIKLTSKYAFFHSIIAFFYLFLTIFIYGYMKTQFSY